MSYLLPGQTIDGMGPQSTDLIAHATKIAEDWISWIEASGAYCTPDGADRMIDQIVQMTREAYSPDLTPSALLRGLYAVQRAVRTHIREWHDEFYGY